MILQLGILCSAVYTQLFYNYNFYKVINEFELIKIQIDTSTPMMNNQIQFNITKVIARQYN